MKGTTHLAIGATIGLAAAAYYPFSFNHAVLYISIAAFSALSADLDGPSMLSSKLGKLSKVLHELILWSGVLSFAGVIYLYFVHQSIDRAFATVAVVLFLLGCVAKAGVIRNALISLIGAGLIAAGWTVSTSWLIGLGLFIACAPWLKHRGMTHTVWAVIIWAAIGSGMERDLQIEGIATVAAAGYLSHLLADTLTPSGVKWLYPLYKKPIKFPLKR